MPSIFTTTVAALAVAPFVTGHSWVEQLRNVNSKGTYVGDYGYPRGYVGKSDPGFNGDSMNWMLPVPPKVFIDETSPLCHSAQRTQKQSSDKYPRLQAVAGGFVTMRYSENGHVTLVDEATGRGKPEKGGTVFVYGTTEPKEDEKLMDVLQWTKNGTGRGVLLATNNFDDERCYEINATPISKDRQATYPNSGMGQTGGGFPLMCDTNAQIPTTAPEGKPYTLYWVWQWNTAKGTEGQLTGKDQYYTTCIDVDVTSGDKALTASAESKYALGQQDGMSEAVKDFDSRTAIITTPVQGEVGPIFGSGNSSTKPSHVPSLSQISNLPTMTPTPSPSSGAGDAVTVTDIVYVTVTAGASSMPAATASAPASTASAPASGFVTSAKPSASGAPHAIVPSAPAAGVSSAAAPAVPSAAPSAGVSSAAVPAVPSAKPTGTPTSAAASASAPASAPTQAPAASGALGGFTMPKPSGAPAAKRALKIRGMAWN